jgi:LPXTG-site transpeptidase (sortase) family protein
MTLYGTPRPATHRPTRRVPWLACVVVALVCTVVGSVGWIALTARTDRAHLDAGQTTLTRAWNLQIAQVDVPAALPAPGGPIGRLYLPKLGLNWVLVEGTSEAALAAGPGHYPGSALPGGKGNFAVAGHRAAGMWLDLDRVQPGDSVIVQTRTKWITYRVTVVRVVDPPVVADWIKPTPPGMSAGRLLTLTTCWPKWDNYRRLVLGAVLERTSPRDEPPSELTGAG